MAKGTLAAVDIGTNSVKMVLGTDTQIALDRVVVTRLGEGVDAEGRLSSVATARTLDALAEFGRIARAHGATRVAAVGTSALRDAANGDAFVRDAARALGGTVEVISGEREAQLVYLAARRDPDLVLPGDALVAVTDVGGGSTEVALGDAREIRFRTSIQLGAVRLTERTRADADPLAAARADAAALLATLPADPAPVALVASGGTAANLAGMALGRLDPVAIHGVRLTRAALAEQVQQLAAMDLDTRRTVPGLEPARADVIVAGAVIQWLLLERFGLDALTVSARGLRYGLLYALRDDS